MGIRSLCPYRRQQKSLRQRLRQRLPQEVVHRPWPWDLPCFILPLGGPDRLSRWLSFRGTAWLLLYQDPLQGRRLDHLLCRRRRRLAYDARRGDVPHRGWSRRHEPGRERRYREAREFHEDLPRSRLFIRQGLFYFQRGLRQEFPGGSALPEESRVPRRRCRLLRRQTHQAWHEDLVQGFQRDPRHHEVWHRRGKSLLDHADSYRRDREQRLHHQGRRRSDRDRRRQDYSQQPWSVRKDHQCHNNLLGFNKVVIWKIYSRKTVQFWKLFGKSESDSVNYTSVTK